MPKPTIDRAFAPGGKVTGNAQALAGYVCGAMLQGTTYVLDEVDPVRATAVYKHADTGNRYSVTIRQISGTE